MFSSWQKRSTGPLSVQLGQVKKSPVFFHMYLAKRGYKTLGPQKWQTPHPSRVWPVSTDWAHYMDSSLRWRVDSR